MQHLKRVRDVVITLVTLSPAVSFADRVVEELVVACSKEADDVRRLACYDGVASSAGTSNRKPTSDGAKSTPLPASIATASDADEFGLEGSEAARQRRAQRPESEEAQKLRSLSAAVTHVATEAQGQLVITLDNSQVWKQKNSDAYFPIDVGDRVTINAGLLGSYRMVNGRRSTQVTRVK